MTKLVLVVSVLAGLLLVRWVGIPSVMAVGGADPGAEVVEEAEEPASGAARSGSGNSRSRAPRSSARPAEARSGGAPELLGYEWSREAALLSELDGGPHASVVESERPVVFPHRRAVGEQALASSEEGGHNSMPVVRDRHETQRLIAKHYPPELRPGRIGGTVVLTLVIDETGRVRDRWISSRNQEERLNAAALQLASELRFVPAQRSGRNVPARREFTVVFRP